MGRVSDTVVAEDAVQGTPRRAIEYQYDVDNEFFQLFLDETMCYSCALWEPGSEDLSLAEAQRAKIRHHIISAHAQNCRRVLDIGCGWGGVLRELVECYGVRNAVGLTLSTHQYEWNRSAAVPGVEVRLEPWEQHRPTEPYDAIISIGAFEHFAKPQFTSLEKVRAYRTFFERCHTWLNPGGSLSLQTFALQSVDRQIIEVTRAAAERFIPDSTAPYAEEIALASSEWFTMQSWRSDGDQYARTMEAWRKGLAEHRAEIVARWGPELLKRFRQTFRSAQTMFEKGQLNLYRVGFRRRDEPQRPELWTEITGEETAQRKALRKLQVPI